MDRNYSEKELAEIRSRLARELEDISNAFGIEAGDIDEDVVNLADEDLIVLAEMYEVLDDFYEEIDDSYEEIIFEPVTDDFADAVYRLVALQRIKTEEAAQLAGKMKWGSYLYAN